MENKFTSKAEIVIDAPVSKVWEALIDPAKVKQYLFGTNMEADWRVGGKVFYRGEWEGKKYEDKGEILEFEPEKKIVSTYWSGMSGLADVPENYMKVSYELSEHDGKTALTITQENAASQDAAEHSGDNWKMVLGKLKEVVEK